jgi:hypothetical protein
LDGVPRLVRLDQLRRRGRLSGKGKDKERETNGLEFTFDFDLKGVYYLPSCDENSVGGEGVEEVGVVERSMRETRMKKGIGVGALHQ